MNPIIQELQNIEWSRTFVPTNTLGGEFVRVERQGVRRAEAWRPEPPSQDPLERSRPDIKYAVSPPPATIWEWIEALVTTALSGALFLAFPMMMVLSALGFQGDRLWPATGVTLPGLCALLVAWRIWLERKRAASAQDADGP